MTIDISKLLNPATPDEASAHRERIKQALSDVETRLAERGRERDDLLLHGADRDLDALDQDVAELTRQRDRLRAAITHLDAERERLAQAEAERDASGMVAAGRMAQKTAMNLTDEIGELLAAAKAKIEMMPRLYAEIEAGIRAARAAGIEHDLRLPHVALSQPAVPDRYEERTVREELPGIYKQAAGGELVRDAQPGEATTRVVTRPVLVERGRAQVNAPDLRTCAIELPNIRDAARPILKRARG